MVLIYEYEAKMLFEKAGIPVPMRTTVGSVREAMDVISSMESDKVVVKAQVLSGGRGKAGLIKVVSKDDARPYLEELFSREFMGKAITMVMLEEVLDIDRELYVGIFLDGDRRELLFMLSTEGGIDIEQVAKDKPDAIKRQYFSPLSTIDAGEFTDLISDLGFTGKQAESLADICARLIKLFREGEFQVAEVNPLIVTKGGELVAADGRVIIDDSAISRHPEYGHFMSLVDENTDVEKDAKDKGLAFVELEGNIAFIACGAGLGMATADLIQAYGGKPANFLDVGGGADAVKVRDALGIINSLEGVDGILVNVFGGITRCDEVAQGIITAKQELNITTPMVIRLLGTMDKEGVAILQDESLEAFTDMEPATRKIVEIVGN